MLTRAGSAEARSGVGPYFAAPFKVGRLGYAFGQAPSWTHDGKVFSTQLDSAGDLADLSRPNRRKSSALPDLQDDQGAERLADGRPQGDWILFESYGKQPVHVGGPGLGGYGGDLYVMGPDGSHPYRLTTNSDPNDGAPYTSEQACHTTTSTPTGRPTAGT